MNEWLIPTFFCLAILFLVLCLNLVHRTSRPTVVKTLRQQASAGQEEEYPERPLRKTNELSYRMVPDAYEEQQISGFLALLNDENAELEPPAWERPVRTPLPTLLVVRSAKARVKSNPKVLPKRPRIRV